MEAGGEILKEAKTMIKSNAKDITDAFKASEGELLAGVKGLTTDFKAQWKSAKTGFKAMVFLTPS